MYPQDLLTLLYQQGSNSVYFLDLLNAYLQKGRCYYYWVFGGGGDGDYRIKNW